MNNLTQFNTLAEYNDFLNSNDCPYVNVSYIGETDEVKYFKEDLSSDTYFNMPFTVEILSIGQDESNCRLFLQPEERYYFKYKVNNGEWITTTDQYITIDNLVVGDKVQIINKSKRTNNNTSALGEFDIWRNDSWDDRIGGDVKIYGNIMSYIVGYEYTTNPTLPEYDSQVDGDYGYFTRLSSSDRFKDILVDAENLWMPFRNIPEKAYDKMFMNYGRLEKATNIKVKELPKYACRSMFAGCTSLTDMPIILAEQVAQDAVSEMFNGCTSLVNTTTLHINKILTGGMRSMFRGCTSLTTTPTWNETITFAENYTNSAFTSIFEGCTGLTDASPVHITIKIDSADNLLNGIFSGCTSLVTGPYIEIVYNGYVNSYGMFDGCSELESVTYLSNDVNFSFGLGDNTKNGVFYYKDGVEYNPADCVPSTWTCQIYSGE